MRSLPARRRGSRVQIIRPRLPVRPKADRCAGGDEGDEGALGGGVFCGRFYIGRIERYVDIAKYRYRFRLRTLFNISNSSELLIIKLLEIYLGKVTNALYLNWRNIETMLGID
jgi:hypothetical protein